MAQFLVRSGADSGGLSALAHGLIVASLIVLLLVIGREIIEPLVIAALLAFKSSAGITWVIAGVGLVGGVYFPLSLFPGWIRWAGSVQPLTPTIDLLRHLLVGTPLAHPAGAEWLKLGAFAAVLLPLATYVLALGLKFSRAQGTVMEY